MGRCKFNVNAVFSGVWYSLFNQRFIYTIYLIFDMSSRLILTYFFNKFNQNIE
jgi:hypothetical protein